jgi:sulfur carrier protein ThiS
MKIRVRLFGMLSQQVLRYDHAKGLAVEVPDDADVAALLALLPIPKSKVGMVSVDGRLARADEKLSAGNSVHLFQPLFGG